MPPKQPFLDLAKCQKSRFKVPTHKKFQKNFHQKFSENPPNGRSRVRSRPKKFRKKILKILSEIFLWVLTLQKFEKFDSDFEGEVFFTTNSSVC